MGLENPVAIYYAKTNTEAMMLCHMLNMVGIEAYAMEDLSLSGLWIGGTATNLHWPKVWVELADADRAAKILIRFEQSRFDHEPERAAGVADETLVQAVCEECGRASLFSSRILGTVQECPFCGKFMDVISAEDMAEFEDEWREKLGDDSEN